MLFSHKNQQPPQLLRTAPLLQPPLIQLPQLLRTVPPPLPALLTVPPVQMLQPVPLVMPDFSWKTPLVLNVLLTVLLVPQLPFVLPVPQEVSF